MQRLGRQTYFWGGVAGIAFGLFFVYLTWLAFEWWETALPLAVFAAIWTALGAGFVWRSRQPGFQESTE